MRLMKMFGLASLAAIAAMAFLGASSASAEFKKLTLCKVQQKLCKAENLWGANQEVVAKATNPVLKAAITQKCNESNTKGVGKQGSADADSTPSEITTLSFTGSCTPCSTVTTLGLPYSAELAMEGENDYLISSGEATLSGCPFGVTCTFGNSGVKLDTVEGTSPKVVANEEVLVFKKGTGEFFCGSKGTWTADYAVSTPSPLWVSLERHSNP